MIKEGKWRVYIRHIILLTLMRLLRLSTRHLLFRISCQVYLLHFCSSHQ